MTGADPKRPSLALILAVTGSFCGRGSCRGGWVRQDKLVSAGLTEAEGIRGLFRYTCGKSSFEKLMREGGEGGRQAHTLAHVEATVSNRPTPLTHSDRYGTSWCRAPTARDAWLHDHRGIQGERLRREA